MEPLLAVSTSSHHPDVTSGESTTSLQWPSFTDCSPMEVSDMDTHTSTVGLKSPPTSRENTTESSRPNNHRCVIWPSGFYNMQYQSTWKAFQSFLMTEGVIRITAFSPIQSASRLCHAHTRELYPQ